MELIGSKELPAPAGHYLPALPALHYGFLVEIVLVAQRS